MSSVLKVILQSNAMSRFYNLLNWVGGKNCSLQGIFELKKECLIARIYQIKFQASNFL